MDLRLHAYLKNLLETAHHLGSDTGRTMPEPLAEKMLADLRIQLERRLMENLLGQLSEPNQQAYANLMEKSDLNQSDVVDFLNSKVPGAGDIVTKTLEQFSQDYITTVNHRPKS